MNLQQYRNVINEIQNLKLKNCEKRAGLRLIAQEIRNALWQLNFKPQAEELIILAETIADQYHEEGILDMDLDGLDGLVEKGLVRLK